MEIGRAVTANGGMSLWKPFLNSPENDDIVCIQITELGEMGCYCKLLDYPHCDLEVDNYLFKSSNFGNLLADGLVV
jgi:hypothetical protein